MKEHHLTTRHNLVSMPSKGVTLLSLKQNVLLQSNWKSKLVDPMETEKGRKFFPDTLICPTPQIEEHCQFKVTYPNLELDPLFIFEYSFYFEIDPNCADECRCKGVIRITEQKRCLPHTAVADDQQFEHVVKVLVRGVFLAIPGILGRGHLWEEKQVCISLPFDINY